MKYAWIKDCKEGYTVSLMCKVLKVSTSGYYDWSKRKPGKRQQRRGILTDAVKASHRGSYEIYGYRKVHEDLVQEHKLDCCKETVRKIMKENGLKSRVKSRFVRTTDSDHEFKCAENILDREFAIYCPDKVWMADITYVSTKEGWLYLSSIMDLYGRRIVGWAMSDRIDTNLVSDALGMAFMHRGKISDLLHHSDRGSQYCSDMYQEVLQRNGITCSMSRKGDCWDNACMESFFGSLKTEWIGDKKYETRAEAQKDIFFYIEMFYNTQRRHASLGYVSPAEYEALYAKEHAV